MSRFSIRAGALAAALVLAAGPAFAQQKTTMRISHQVPPAHHMSKMLEGFAADVKARTKGEVEVQLYGSEQLAKAGENFPSVAKGAFEAAMSVNFQWGKTIPEMSALTIPYLFTDLERIKKFPASEARKFLDAELAKRGVTSVAWLYITRQSIFTSGKKPAEIPTFCWYATLAVPELIACAVGLAFGYVTVAFRKSYEAKFAAQAAVAAPEAAAKG